MTDLLATTKTAPTATPSWAQRACRSAFLGRLGALHHGRVELREAWHDVVTVFGNAPATDRLRAVLHVHDPAFYTTLALRGTIGAAEAYRDGLWSSRDLPTLVRIMVRNRDVLDSMEGGLARLSAPVQRLLHRRRANTRSGSRRNIADHYDLGNDFFELFLDASMTYSSGLFASPTDTLEQAQTAKLDRLCRKLDLQPGDHLLEIGTGWGSMAIHAARHFGCRVTTTTISGEQLAIARERVAQSGLDDRIEILCTDYRDLEGSFDKLVSVEMIEAVGADFLEAYLATCSRLLKPTGLLALQAITIQDQHYARALREVDFIKRYIFPGSFIPSTTAICTAATRATDLRLTHLEDMAPHYATTLHHWRRRLDQNRAAIRACGYDEPFLRLWEYYLAYCEGGFAERFLGVGQFVFAKPDSRRDPILPELPGPDRAG